MNVSNDDELSESSTNTDDVLAELDEPSGGASFSIVGVGASAGGLEAFTQLLRALPADTGMAFVLVQHLAPTHPSALAEILARTTKMRVMEVRDEPAVEPNHVYVIPPDRSMMIVRGRLHLLPREGRGAHHPVDQFFRSLAKEYRHQAIGVVLSGTATDGTIGLEEIKAEGGMTFAQDATAQQEGMPHSAIASGCVDFVLSPVEIAREIVRIGQYPYAVPTTKADDADERATLSEVVQVLYHATGVDFSGYKFNTLYRRVTRRMILQKMVGLTEYVQFLRETPAEAEALYQDILISVTSFFRDKESFEALKTAVFPRLLKDRARRDPVRIWSLGCSTGQEAYSIAMAFVEATEAAGSNVPFQLFASDLNAAGIEKARAALYPKDINQDVSAQRLRRFFTEVDGQYRIAKSIRDACVFSRHNVLADAPFSRIDLISCRNLLIYLEPVLQQRIMPILHYALKPAGCLWLGGSETIGGYRSLFEAEDAKHKIYSKKLGGSTVPGGFPVRLSGVSRAPFVPITARPSDGADLPREADRILLTKFAPPGVLVNADLDILQYRGDISRYLAPAPGKPSLNLLKILREGLLVAVRAATVRAVKDGVPVREEGLRVKSDNGYREISIEVIPLKEPRAKNSGFLILFEEAGLASRTAPPTPEPLAIDADSARLQQDLVDAHAYLQTVIEQQEAANEELQSANEEVQSANEELQSTNEELETSKEEIQSSNEELATVNDELNNRNAELHRVNNDLVNVLSSVQMPIVILGSDFRVRLFTPSAEKLLNLIPNDVGRPLADIKLHLDALPNLEPLLAEVVDTVSARECDVLDKHGRWYSLRLRPYRTLDNKIDGVLLMLVDVDAMKRAEAVSAYLSAIVTSSDDAIISKNLDSVITSWNSAAERLFGYTAEESIGKPETMLMPADQIDEGPGILDRIRRGETIAHYETVRRRKDGSLLDISLTVSPINDAAGRVIGAAQIAHGITEMKRTQEALRASEDRYRTLFDLGPVAIYSCDASGVIQNFNRHAAKLWGRAPAAGDTDERFCGSFKMTRPDGSCMAHDECPMSEVLRGEIPEVLNGEVLIERPDNSRITVIVNIRPLKNERGEVTGAINCFYDVTHRKLQENELRRYAADLSETNRRKTEFLAMLAHELRNPLAPIRNAVQVLRFTGVTGEALASASEMMERQIGQMVRLVDDLLDVNRISRGKIELRRGHIELESVVNQAVEAARPSCERMEHELTVTLPSKPIYLNADATRLTQIIENLLNNACKFTDKGGRISLTVEREGGQAVIRVRDTGIGIAADQLPRIFDMFIQIDTSLERSASGLGIGLTLVKSLVEMHDGTVEVFSAGVGHGSEFVVRLPIMVEPAQLPPPEQTASEPTTTKACRILVVDDNRDSAESLATLLRLTGHETHTAHDGLEAVEAAARIKPDAVLLDIGLPKLNGYEVARKIREQPWGKDMVLIALTGWGQEEDRQKSNDAGFNGHLVKPVELAAVTKLLTEFVPKTA